MDSEGKNMQRREDGICIDPYFEDLERFEYNVPRQETYEEQNEKTLSHELPIMTDGTKPIMGMTVPKKMSASCPNLERSMREQKRAMKDASKDQSNMRHIYVTLDLIFTELEQHYPEYITPYLKQKAKDILYNFFRTPQGKNALRYENLRYMYVGAAIYKACTSHCVILADEALLDLIDDMYRRENVVTPLRHFGFDTVEKVFIDADDFDKLREIAHQCIGKEKAIKLFYQKISKYNSEHPNARIIIYSARDSTFSRRSINEALLAINKSHYEVLRKNKQKFSEETKKEFLIATRNYLVDQKIDLDMIRKLMITIEKIYDTMRADITKHKKTVLIPAIVKFAYMVHYPKQVRFVQYNTEKKENCQNFVIVGSNANAKTTVNTIFNELSDKFGVMPLTSHRTKSVMSQFQDRPEGFYNQIYITDEGRLILSVLPTKEKIATTFQLDCIPKTGVALVSSSPKTSAPFKFEIRDSRKGRLFVAVYHRASTARFPKKTKTGTTEKVNCQSHDQHGIYEHEFVRVIEQFVERKELYLKDIWETLNISRSKAVAASKLLQHLNVIERVDNKYWHLTVSVAELSKRLVATFKMQPLQDAQPVSIAPKIKSKVATIQQQN